MSAEYIKMTPVWTITKYASDADYENNNPYEIKEVKGNLLLNEGATALWTLFSGGVETAFSAANAYLAVGDSSTSAAAAQTGLQASTNKLYKAVSGAPTISTTQISYTASFGASEANFAWNEFTLANGNSDSADNLNRKVDAQGTKTSGQTWTLTLTITLS